VPVHWEPIAVPPGTTDALTRAALVLSALVVTRAGAVAALGAASRLPGRLGRAAAGLGRALRPGVARRLLAAALGLGVPAVVTVADLAPATAQSADPARAGGPVTTTPAGADGAARPRGDLPPGVTVVVPGDTLWDIARRHLPDGATDADVARAWPRWYAVNRAVIGPDPALIRPGMRLRLPDRRSTGTSTSSHDRPSATRTDAGAVARSLDPDRR
jgi:nucleoid-associated protein YgaU